METFTPVALALLLAAAPATAEELKKLPAGLDPAKAYVVVEVGAVDETKVPGNLIVARYDAVSADLLGLGRSAAKGDASRDGATKGLIRDKLRRSKLHLLELEPALYVVEAANGTSFSLGSRSFRAEAGQVLDLGVMRVATDRPDGEEPAKIGVKDILKMGLLGGFGGPKQQPRPVFVTHRNREASDIGLPPMLAAQVRPVVWEARAVTFGNHLGGLVNRFGGRAERVTRQTAATAQDAAIPQQ